MCPNVDMDQQHFNVKHELIIVIDCITIFFACFGQGYFKFILLSSQYQALIVAETKD